MRERVNEIIEYLLEASRQNEVRGENFPAGAALNLGEISKELLKEGYTEPEIHKAVEWFLSHLQSKLDQMPTQFTDRTPRSIRVLIAEELSFFTPEAYGYLIQLQTLGILTPIQVEQVLERCFMVGVARIGIEDFKTIVSQIIIGEGVGRGSSGKNYHPGNDRVN